MQGVAPDRTTLVLDLGQGRARVRPVRPYDLVVLDLVVGYLPGRREDGEDGHEAEGQRETHGGLGSETPAYAGERPRENRSVKGRVTDRFSSLFFFCFCAQ